MMHHPHHNGHQQHPMHGMHGGHVVNSNVPTGTRGGHPVLHQVGQHQMPPPMQGHRDQMRMNQQRMAPHVHQSHPPPQPQRPLLIGIPPPHVPPPNKARKHDASVFTVEDIEQMFGPNGCIEGMLMTMGTGIAPVVSAHPQASTANKVTPSQTVPATPAVGSVLEDPSEVEVAPPNTRPDNTTTNNNALINTLANTKEKTPMCLVNELARYNKITHQYRLTSEEGPAHKKRFTVTLKLGEEEYASVGASIKKAQHSAAADALSKTQYKHPPPKTTRNIRIGVSAKINHVGIGNITPTVELNALAMKRGEATIYHLESTSNLTNPNQNMHPSAQYMNMPPPSMQQQQGQSANFSSYQRSNNMYPQQNRFNNYDRRGVVRNYNNHDNQRYWKYSGSGYNGNMPDTLYTVMLKVGTRDFTGHGSTAQLARHDAAAKALQDLKTLPLPDEETCPVQPIDNATLNIDDDPNSDLKSPISLVHEIALKRNLVVQFEVLSEKGPPHMKVFVTLCRVGEFTTEGEGNGKKISKKRAAEKMLEELRKLGPTAPAPVAVQARLKRKPQVNKKKTRNLIKEKVEPEYTEEINPISRLIQIQQANKEKEPVYTLVEERGASRRREFVMEVTAGGYTATGMGPNKKHAKRVAAENLLTQMGLEPTKVSTAPVKPSIKPEMNDPGNPIPDKPRKVTFLEGDPAPVSAQATVNAGGSAGRQLVPGLLLMQDQNSAGYNANTPTKSGMNVQTTATIAKEFLSAGSSPTAEALAKAGHSQKLSGSGASIGTPAQVLSTPLSSNQVIRPKDQLMYLAQLLGFQVQFSDFPKGNHNEFLSLITLTTEPPQVCHGSGGSTEASHDQASLTALQMLSKMGLDNVTAHKKDNPGVGMGGDGIHVGMSSIGKIPKSGILSNGLKK